MQNFFAFLLVLIAASEASKVLVPFHRSEATQILIRRGSPKAGKDVGKVLPARSPSPQTGVQSSHARSRGREISRAGAASTPFANSAASPHVRTEASRRSPAGSPTSGPQLLQMPKITIKKEESPPVKLGPYLDSTDGKEGLPIKSEPSGNGGSGAIAHRKVRDILQRISQPAAQTLTTGGANNQQSATLNQYQQNRRASQTGTTTQRRGVSVRRAGAMQGASQTKSMDPISSMDPAYRSMLLQLRPGQAPSSKKEALAALPPHMRRFPSINGLEPAPSGSQSESQSGSRMPTPSSRLTRQRSAFSPIPPRGSSQSPSENGADQGSVPSQSNGAGSGTGLRRGSPDSSEREDVNPKRQKKDGG